MENYHHEQDALRELDPMTRTELVLFILWLVAENHLHPGAIRQWKREVLNPPPSPTDPPT